MITPQLHFDAHKGHVVINIGEHLPPNSLVKQYERFYTPVAAIGLTYLIYECTKSELDISDTTYNDRIFFTAIVSGLALGLKMGCCFLRSMESLKDHRT